MSDQASVVEIIGPERAAVLLANPLDSQRTIRPPRIAQHVGKMIRGEWKHNPLDCLGITADGRLANGNHRLMAVVQTGIPQKFSVVYGVDPDVYKVVDQGLPRNLADYLKASGESNASDLGAVIGWQFREEVGRENATQGGVYRLAVGLVPTPGQVDEVLSRHPGLRSVVNVHSRVAEPNRLLPKSITNWTYYRFSNIDQERADVFWEGAGSGLDLSQDDPRYVLRKVLLRRTEGETRGRSSEFVAALVVKGWNAFLEGKSVKVIAWREGESFPFIKGE